MNDLASKLQWIRAHHAYDGVRTLCRLLAWEARVMAQRPAIVAFATVNARFFCPPEQRGTAGLVFLFRDRYEAELQYVAKFVRPGDTVIDAGAHYGAYTVVLSKLVGPGGRVIAIEPAPHAIEVLTHNLELNGLTNVEVHQVALGSEEGRMDLYTHPDPSRNSLSETPGATGTESVAVRRLDDLVGSRKPTFMKIDVEGAEPLAFSGAGGVLGELSTVLFEHHPEGSRRMGLPRMGGWDALRSAGYETWTLLDNGEMTPAVPGDAFANYIAIRDDSQQ